MMSEGEQEMLSEFYDDPDPPTYPWAIRLREKLPSTMPFEWIIGYKFGVHIDSGYQVDSLIEYHELYQRWGSYSREPIHWLTKPRESELQLLYTAVSHCISSSLKYLANIYNSTAMKQPRKQCTQTVLFW